MRRLPPILVALASFVSLAPARAEPPPAPPAPSDPLAPHGAFKVERYPPSWRLKVAESIERGVESIKRMQESDGHWGGAKDPQVMGHTALPLLTLLKAGVPADDEHVTLAFTFLDTQAFSYTYSAACYLMAIHARYAPHLDTLDTDVDTARAARSDPAATKALLSPVHAKRVEQGLAFLRSAQTADGLWSYGVQLEGRRDYDLSNTQYALLGLRAAADCGAEVPDEVWRASLRALATHQEAKGPKSELQTLEVKDGYAFQHRDASSARGWRYKDEFTDGPLGKATVPTLPTTGSMTTSGLGCLAIAREGLWHTRRFTGRERKQVEDALRDGLTWLQDHYDVTDNPGAPGANHLYYLYGLERAGMLLGRRWVGTHDWYREGADLLMGLQTEAGAWGDHVACSFAVLFLKRATRTPDVTGD